MHNLGWYNEMSIREKLGLNTIKIFPFCYIICHWRFYGVRIISFLKKLFFQSEASHAHSMVESRGFHSYDIAQYIKGSQTPWFFVLNV